MTFINAIITRGISFAINPPSGCLSVKNVRYSGIILVKYWRRKLLFGDEERSVKIPHLSRVFIYYVSWYADILDFTLTSLLQGSKRMASNISQRNGDTNSLLFDVQFA